MQSRFILFVFFVFVSIFGAEQSWASCGSASCPLNNYRSIKAGWCGLSIMHEYINQDQVYVGSSKSYIGAIPEEHDEVQTLNERNTFHLQAGLSDKFGLSVDVPMVHREHSHIHHGATEDEWEQWNFTGLGDIAVTGNFILFDSGEGAEQSLGLILGVKLPSGLTNEKSVGAGEEGEVTIQPGTGSTDMIIGLNYRQHFLSVPMIGGMYSSMPITLGATYQASGSGSYDYRYGNSLLAHLGTSYQFIGHASALLQFNGRFVGYADVGTTGEPVENTGGTWIFVSPGFSIDAPGGFTATGYVQFPIYQNVHGIQQTAKYNLLFSVGYGFDLKEQ